MSSSWNKVCLPTEVDDFGVPDLSIDHGYALRSGWPQTVVQAPFLSFSFLSPLIFICQSSWEILSKMVPR